LEVLIQTHPVFAGSNHSKITIIPGENSRFKGDPRFKNKTPDGGDFSTLGAGPSGTLAFGDLQSDPNRKKDVNLSRNNYSASAFTSSCPTQEVEDNYIQQLFDADSRFDYELLPEAGEYNSNSYINGLLRSVGLKVPAPPSTPGFTQPVPNSAFR
jgi:hypothetical protein